MSQQIDIVANLLMKVDGAEAGINKIKNSLSKLKMPKGLEENFKKSFSDLDTIFARYRSQVEKGFETKGDVTAFNKTSKALETELNRISKYFTELTGKEVDFKVNNAAIIQTSKELETLIKQRDELAKSSLKFSIEGGDKGAQEIKTLLEELKTAAGNTKTSEYANEAMNFLNVGDVQSAVALLEKASVACKKLKQEKQDMFKAETGFDMSNALAKIILELTGVEGKFGNVNSQIDETGNKLTNLHTEQYIEAGNRVEALSNDFNENKVAIDRANGAMQDYARSSFEASQQLKDLQQSTQYFFSLRNMFNLLKRGLKDAVQVVKELDAAMTETAVVTEFSVSDMWAKLPEYTANANVLGATIKDMYASTTLYYQQGLNTNQAMSIATETMKMARIAGLEAKDATDMMTAALRGFNMELNETSATRINDVYSNLAAKTASDTKEIGTAMQRTASIAASAGMSFEGTAAFLAQAIETTREPAENIGTAMKTIVARFTEMKKNPLELVEVEGEEVSYNKIDTALQSIGVSLKDANGQFRALDQVFLDISQRWNSLTQTQQRYIATVAAGSRQQSRFIAMMSNYDRTMELMGYANDSAGASQEQFGKTLDSLEAKLNKFKNAWNEFLMGIMNDTWTKALVDGGTKALDIINSLINALSLNGKLKGVRSFLSIFTAFKGLKLAGRGINGLFGGLGNILTPGSDKTFMQGFKVGAIGKGKTEISQSTNRIVKAIYDLVPHIDKDAVNATNQYRFQERGNYGDARKELNRQLNLSNNKGSYTAGGILDILNKNQLNKRQQANFFQASPGLKSNLVKSLSRLYTDVGTDKKVQQALLSGFKSGDIALEEALLGNDKLTTSVGERYQELLAEATKEGLSDAAKEGAELRAKEFFEAERQKLKVSGEQQGLKGEDLDKFIADENVRAQKTLNQAGRDFLANPQTLTNSEKLANVIGKVGAGFMSAGSAIQMAGARLSQINPVVGEAISNFGGLLTTIGSLANVLPSILAGGPVAWGIAAAVAAIGTVYTIAQTKAKKAQKEATKVADTYKEVKDETQANISALKQYQSQAERWARGVDSFGNNINLSTEEFAEYQDAVARIAEINPDIVEGYNAQGKAIININKALSETIALEKQRQDEAVQDYTSDAAFDAAIRARDTTDAYQTITLTSKFEEDSFGKWIWGKEGNFGFDLGKWIDTKLDTNWFTKATAPFTDELSDITEKTLTIFDNDTEKLSDFYQKFGIDVDKLTEGDEFEIAKFMKNRQAIQSALVSESGGELPDKLGDSFDKLTEKADAFDEATAQLVNMLQVYTSNLASFQDVPEEFRSFIMSGLENIAITPDLNVDQMKGQAGALVRSFQNLTAKGSKYAVAMEGISAAQTKYAENLNADQYNKAVQKYADELSLEADRLAANGDAVSLAMAEFYQNEAEKALKYTENGQYRLVEALNGMIGAIHSAEDALSTFQEATKTDFSTGVENMKSIYDTIFEGTHADAYGDNTFWTGAEMLLGADTIDELGGDIDAVKKALKGLAPILEEGEDGFANFWDKFRQVDDSKIEGFDWKADGSYTIDRKVNPQVYEQIADAMNMSADLFIASLNKGRQYAEIDFMDTDMVRAALGADEAAIKNGQEIYVKEDYIKDALKEAGAKNTTEVNEALARLEAKGVHIIDPPESFNAEDAKQLGIDSLPKLIETLGNTGQYNREEILDYARQLFDEDYITANYDNAYDDYAGNLEYPVLEPVKTIESEVASIRDLLASQEIRKGNITNDDIERAKELRTTAWGTEAGDDGVVQMFGQGRDINGKALSEANFVETYKALVRTRDEIYQDLQNATLGLQEAKKSGNEEAIRNAQEYYDILKQAHDSYNSNIQEGLNNWAKTHAEEAVSQASDDMTDNGVSIATARAESQAIYDEAYQYGSSIIQSLRDGTYDSLVNAPKFESNYKNPVPRPDTNAPEGAYTDSSSITKTIKYESEGAEEVKAEEDEIQEKAEQGATVNIEYRTQGDPAPSVQPTTVKTGEVDTSSVEAAKRGIENSTAQLPVKAIDQTAQGIAAIKQKISVNSASIPVKVKPSGSMSITFHAAAKGLNNKIPYIHVPEAGSLAKGTKKGRVGPRNQGGMTLTGERGFEIAWLPKESRSIILGANGPQMINLPKDAVVYNHEQSQDIMKKRTTIPAGSMDEGSYRRRKNKGTTVSTSKKTKKTKKSKSKGSSSTDGNNWSIEEAIRFDIDVDVTRLKDSVDNLAKQIDKNLEKIGTRSSDIAKIYTEQIKQLKEMKQYNQDIIDSYKRQYKNLDSNYTETISYKSGKKSKEAKVNLGKYITQENGVYKIDISALEKESNKNKREAIYNAVNKVIKEANDGIQKAQKEIEALNEQIEEAQKKIYEAFYAWENEITRIYNITQKINNIQSRRDRFAEQIALEASRLSAGFGDLSQSIAAVHEATARSNDELVRQVQLQQEMIEARKAEQDNAYSWLDELAEYNNIKEQEPDNEYGIQAAKEQLKAARMMQNYINNYKELADGTVTYNIDYAQLEQDRLAGNINKETYDRIKEGLDKFNDAAVETNNAIKEQTSLIKENYDLVRDYQDKQVNLESDLLEGLKDKIKKDIDNSKKLSSAIVNALKDLLDQVKRKLDERRKAEDNEKTETDILQKQQRLAMLRADTSGGHQVEIAQLEREIADAQQSYQRTLEDQLLERLQNQADEAAKQRERQIDLLEAINEIGADNRELVRQWVEHPEQYAEQIRQTLMTKENYDEMGFLAQEQYQRDIDARMIEIVEAAKQLQSTKDPETYLVQLLNLQNAQSNLNGSRSNVATAESELAAANEELLKANNDLTAAQNNLATALSEQTRAKKAEDAAKTAYEKASKKKKKKAKDAYDEAVAARKKADTKVTNAQTVVNTATSNRDAKAADVVSAEAKLQEAKDAAEQARIAFEEAEQAVQNYESGSTLADVLALSQAEEAFVNWANTAQGGQPIDSAITAGEAEAARVLEEAANASATETEPTAILNKLPGKDIRKSSSDTEKLQEGLNQLLADGKLSGFEKLAVDGDYGRKTKAAVKILQTAIGATVDGIWGSQTLKKLKASALKAYRKGGLADYTGPAWLDGTPSKPELVLNAADTKNFLALRDVLSKAVGATGAINNSYGGDATYEININVDHLNNDYDVDKVAERVKKIIVKDSSYRNVTQVRNFR